MTAGARGMDLPSKTLFKFKDNKTGSHKEGINQERNTQQRQIKRFLSILFSLPPPPLLSVNGGSKSKGMHLTPSTTVWKGPQLPRRSWGPVCYKCTVPTQKKDNTHPHHRNQTHDVGHTGQRSSITGRASLHSLPPGTPPAASWWSGHHRQRH